MFKFQRDAKLFLWGNFLFGFGLTGFIFLFNLYMKARGFGEGSIGTLLAVRNYATMLLTIPAALIVRKMTLKPLFLIVVIFSAIGYTIPVIAESMPQILSGMAISGLFAAFFSVISGPFIMQTSTKRERTHLFSFNFAVSISSGILGNIVAGNLPLIISRGGVSLVTGYRDAMLIHIVFSLFSLVPFLLIKEKGLADRETLTHFTHVSTSKLLILKLSLPHILVGLGAGITIPFLNLYFRDKFLLNSAQIGYLFSISQALMIVGTLLAPFFSKRLGKIKTVILSQLLSVPFLFLLGVTHNLLIAIISFLLRAALMNMAQPLVTNFSLEMVNKNDQSLISGILNVAWLSAWGISANIGGKLIEAKGYLMPFNLTIVAYLVSSFVYALVLLPMEREK
ncbi:MAG: MFS transporter [candidate division WOR-3 bacterium]|nr:MFS transporter [candidate division WOR-3 bacterium]